MADDDAVALRRDLDDLLEAVKRYAAAAGGGARTNPLTDEQRAAKALGTAVAEIIRRNRS